ncbi:hypothetical protein [Limnospira platensis]|uniref:hypothetical protein n=1 Tax=Limnospira platensis TaxID=118562 RepID=UPI0029437DF1|nr:hypothetical protein [Arthrospira sp. PLM2.Bin9]
MTIKDSENPKLSTVFQPSNIIGKLIDTKKNEEEVRSPFPKQLQPLPAYPFSASQ